MNTLYDNERPEKVLEFLQKVDDLCREYGLIIEHEDTGGAFLIFDEKNARYSREWFRDAAYCTNDK